MPEDLDGALRALRPLLLDPDRLVRAVAAGRRRSGTPDWRRVEVRPVDLKAGRHLQVVAYDDRAATTSNQAYGDPAEAEVDALLAQPFGNWHVQTTAETVQLRVTKKGQAQVHRVAQGGEQTTRHDRAARHLIDPGDPLFTVLGANASKRRQVDAFLRVLDGALSESRLPDDTPLRVVDLGCGNAYLTFAAYRFLTGRDGGREVRLTGIDRRPEMRERNTAIAEELGWSRSVTFEAGDIADADLGAEGAVDIALALHACDTATDDALAQAVHRDAAVVLASPCCHHDVQRQISAGSAPAPYGVLARHAILRDRMGDLLTDAVRAALLRQVGYRVDVVAFVSAEYTPRNTMIRAVRAAVPGEVATDEARREYADLVAAWGITPHLQTLLADDLAGR